MLRSFVLFLAAVLTATPLAAQTIREIPLRVEGGRLVVSVEMEGGYAFDFALSTGNAVTVLSETLASHPPEALGLYLGDVPVSLDGMATVPDADLVTGGVQLHGMIGGNMLSEFDVLIDVPNERLLLKDIGRAVEWEGVALGEPHRMRLLHGVVISMDIEVDDEQYAATLDLGTPSVLVNSALGGKLGFSDTGRGTVAIGQGVYHEMALTVKDLPVFSRWDPNGNGFILLGAPIAYDCAVSLSWVHQEIRTCAR